MRCLTASETAKKLGVSLSTVHRLVKEGRLWRMNATPSTKQKRIPCRVPEYAVDMFILGVADAEKQYQKYLTLIEQKNEK